MTCRAQMSDNVLTTHLRQCLPAERALALPAPPGEPLGWWSCRLFDIMSLEKLSEVVIKAQ